jgi:hypothetical protein
MVAYIAHGLITLIALFGLLKLWRPNSASTISGEIGTAAQKPTSQSAQKPSYRARHRVAGYLLGGLAWTAAGAVLALLPTAVRGVDPNATLLVAIAPACMLLAFGSVAQLVTARAILRLGAWCRFSLGTRRCLVRYNSSFRGGRSDRRCCGRTPSELGICHRLRVGAGGMATEYFAKALFVAKLVSPGTKPPSCHPAAGKSNDSPRKRHLPTICRAHLACRKRTLCQVPIPKVRAMGCRAAGKWLEGVAVKNPSIGLRDTVEPRRPGKAARRNGSELIEPA